MGYVCLGSGEALRVVPVYILNPLPQGIRDMGYELGALIAPPPALHAAAAQAARPPVPGAPARPVQQGTSSATSFTSSSPAALDKEGDKNPFDDVEYVTALAPLGTSAPLGLGNGQHTAASGMNVAPTSKEFSADLAASATTNREVRDNSVVVLLCDTASSTNPVLCTVYFMIRATR